MIWRRLHSWNKWNPIKFGYFNPLWTKYPIKFLRFLMNLSLVKTRKQFRNFHNKNCGFNLKFKQITKKKESCIKNKLMDWDKYWTIKSFKLNVIIILIKINQSGLNFMKIFLMLFNWFSFKYLLAGKLLKISLLVKIRIEDLLLKDQRLVIFSMSLNLSKTEKYWYKRGYKMGKYLPLQMQVQRNLFSKIWT